ncbi:MAG: DUF2064 domain-containing protein [Actinobacteria bacterium]|nr:DUF2064 domain-containing protein [Actinomycetota bacterium]
MSDVQLLVIAKAPVAGRSKTRLSPPCSPEEAAWLAEAALACTLQAVAVTPASRRVLVLDGEPGAWMPDGFQVLPQRGAGLDERLGAAFEDAGAPSLLIGMDTPQVTPTLLGEAVEALTTPGVDAVLGRATDGGWWAVGLRRPDPAAFLGVPMSMAQTHAAQLRRLAALGYRVEQLAELRDVDRFDDALAVAAEIPGSEFARRLREIRDGRR